jgi:hypothetical protein
MVEKQAHYRHDLGGGLFLDAFAVDPKLDEADLEKLITDKEGTANVDLAEQGKITVFGEKLDSIDDLEFNVDLDREYLVPEQLQTLRDAIGVKNDAQGWYNGPVAIVDGEMKNTISVFRGGFYDFVATKLNSVPHDLERDLSFVERILPGLNEVVKTFGRKSFAFKQIGQTYEKITKFGEAYEKVKGIYPEGQTVEDLFSEWKVDTEDRARYLGIGYLLFSNGGKELSLVQRAKGMAIADDCISSSGSTPNPPFDEKGFDMKTYLKGHIATEMMEEYKMAEDEVEMGAVYLFDDKKEVPALSVHARTQLPTSELAKRIYGDAGAIKEHPALISFPSEAIEIVNQRFEVFAPVATILDTYIQNR